MTNFRDWIGAQCATDSPVVLVLDVYSGRPNPRWTLSAEQAGSLLRRLESLPAKPAPAACPPVPGLGYRGVLLAVEQGGASAELRVCGGYCVGAGECRADTGAELERWLLATMPPTLDPDALRVALAACR